MVHLAIRLSRRTMSHLGRETFLTPVFWQDGWLIAGNRRMAALECEGPLWEAQRTEYVMEPDFHRREWEPEWLFLRSPRQKAYERGEGELRLYPSPVRLSDGKNPVFAAVRQPDFSFELEVSFDFEPCGPGDEAGIAMVVSSQFHYCFVKKKTEEGIFLILEKTAEDMRQEGCRISVPSGELRLRIQGEKEYYHFSYSIDGKDYLEAAKASTRFLACEVSGRCFTGTVLGLYAASDDKTEAVMRVRDFHIRTV